MLIHFLSDLLRNPQTQWAFTRDPELAMSAAGLSTQSKQALRSRDRGAVVAAIVAELGTIDTSQVIFWPAPKVTVRSVLPDRGSRGTTVTLTVTGLWFDTDASCQLVLDDTTINGKVVSVTGQENTVLVAAFDLSPGARPGAYGVRVANDPENSDTLPRAFTLVE